MEAEVRTQLAFHVTGRRSGALQPVEGHALRPALFAAYRDLTALRYDFPLVLVKGGADGAWVQSLTGIVDAILQIIAPRGAQGERTRRQVLRLEREIRRRCAAGEFGSLTTLWDQSAAALRQQSTEDLNDSFDRARAALSVDGEILDCNAAMPARLFACAWRTVQEQRLKRLAERVEKLTLSLSNVLSAHFSRSDDGRTPQALAAAVGPVFSDVFDFGAMSRLLQSPSLKGHFPDSRRRRIERALDVLRAQPFLPARGDRDSADRDPLREFVFDECGAAVDAYRRRLASVVELVKAMAIAELEIEGRYLEAEHDAFFAAFDQSSLGADDLALFPDLLVLVGSKEGADRRSAIMEVLSSGLPIKVVAETDDVLGGSLLAEGSFAPGGARLAMMAVGLNDVYVLQAPASALYVLRERIAQGLAYRGPALFSVFSGANKEASALPPYLAAAAAMQSRAFPAFSYDPSAGPNLAARFSLDGNPQPEADWPRHAFVYEDGDHQRVTQELAFTLADFVVGDARCARHFARVPRSQWTDGMVPVGEWLACDGDLGDKVPYVLVIDAEQKLHRSIADESVIAAARRCRDLWHRLQELGGIRNSYAERLLAREKQAWEEEKQRELARARAESARAEPAPAAAPTTVAPAPAAAAAASAAAPAAAAAEVDKPSDEPYIETLRCTSCNECTNLNNRMFAYNENKQAYIADPSAGTYRELVEAAESCQVSIIHPGKPRDPGEPDLAELMKRAEPFL